MTQGQKKKESTATDPELIQMLTLGDMKFKSSYYKYNQDLKKKTHIEWTDGESKHI